MATRGGLTEVAGFIQGDEELQLFDIHDASSTSWGGQRVRG
jgi:hypothetical protein